MKCFQVLYNEVLIIDDKKEYCDTPSNFLLDGGSLNTITVALDGKTEQVEPIKVIYDDNQQCCVVNDKFYDYPNDDLEGYIALVDGYIKAKEDREYIPPTLEELKQKALSYQYRKYEALKHAVVWLEDGRGYGFDTAPEDQNNWQVALTLMGTGTTMYRVYTNKNNLKEKDFLEVSYAQMLEAGQLAKQQQIKAYSGFEQIKDAIENCKSKEELEPYMEPQPL